MKTYNVRFTVELRTLMVDSHEVEAESQEAAEEMVRKMIWDGEVEAKTESDCQIMEVFVLGGEG